MSALARRLASTLHLSPISTAFSAPATSPLASSAQSWNTLLRRTTVPSALAPRASPTLPCRSFSVDNNDNSSTPTGASGDDSATKPEGDVPVETTENAVEGEGEGEGEAEGDGDVPAVLASIQVQRRESDMPPDIPLSKALLRQIKDLKTMAKVGGGRDLVYETVLKDQTVTRPSLQRLKTVPPLREPVKDHKHFLEMLGRGNVEHASKFKDWAHMCTCTGKDMKELGIPIAARKWILKYIEMYRQGVDPYEIPMKDRALVKIKNRKRIKNRRAVEREKALAKRHKKSKFY